MRPMYIWLIVFLTSAAAVCYWVLTSYNPLGLILLPATMVFIFIGLNNQWNYDFKRADFKTKRRMVKELYDIR